MDGLASGIGIIITFAMATIAFIGGEVFEAVSALTIAGGLAAILLFNFKPALIFLGDSGSQLVGLILGALAIRIATNDGVFNLPGIALILSIPIFDTFLAILRRFSTSESPANGDHNHIHHCLYRKILSVPRVVLILWSANLIVCLMGLMFFYTIGVVAGLMALVLVTMELYLGVRIGCMDYRALTTQLKTRLRYQREGRHIAINVHAIAELDNLWEKMKPLFEQMPLDRAILTLEGIGPDGSPNSETYQWVRSGGRLAELLASRWTKRFTLDDDQRQVAILQLESARQLNREEQRIDWLLKQIRENMKHARPNNTGFARDNELVSIGTEQ